MALLWDLEIGAEIMNSQIEMHSGAVIIFDWYQGERKPLKYQKLSYPIKIMWIFSYSHLPNLLLCKNILLTRGFFTSNLMTTPRILYQILHWKIEWAWNSELYLYRFYWAPNALILDVFLCGRYSENFFYTVPWMCYSSNIVKFENFKCINFETL